MAAQHRWLDMQRLSSGPPIALGGALVAVAVAGALGAVTAQQPLLGLGAGTAALLGLTIAARPDAATLVVIGVLYSNAAVIAVHFHGLPVFASAAVPLLLVVPLAYYVVARRQRVIATPGLRGMVGLLLVQILSSIFAADSADASGALLTFVSEGFVLYLLITNVVRTGALLRHVVWVLLGVGALLGALSTYQELTHTYANDYFGFAQVSNAAFGTGERTLTGEILQPRLAGPIGEQNRYAQVMLMVVPLGLFRYWSERSPPLRLLALCMTAFTALGIAFTFSRGAAIGFVLMIAIMAFLRYIRPRQIAAIVLGLALVLVAVPEYGNRLVTLDALTSFVSDEGPQDAADGSLMSRATENLAAALVFADHPLLGVGPGQFPRYYRDYAELVGIRVLATDRQAHDLYLDIAAETGILGLGAFLAVVLVTLRDLARARRRWSRERPELANLATGFMLAMVSYLTTGLFLHLAFERYLWLMLGLAAAAGGIALREAAAADAAPQRA